MLAAGGVVAFPTETVYGLGADARRDDAVGRIFAAKGRPSDNPLIVHVADRRTVDALAERVEDLERALMDAFWPGPLTLVLAARAGAVSPRVTAGLSTVAVRMPAHEVALRLVERSACPLAAPSANRSGRPSPTTASHVREDLDGLIDGIVDGGPTPGGLESTVVRLVAGALHVLRPGGVTAEQLAAVVGRGVPVLTAPAGPARHEPALDPPRSPGVRYAHYAPRGEMLLVSGADDATRIAAVREAAADARRAGRRVGVLACSEHADRFAEVAERVLDLGARARPEEAARRLYTLLRQCDALGLEVVVAEGVPERGLGAALMDRLRKAAGGRERRV